MSSSLFTKPSLPVAPKARQLPQHPKMRLSYILNPAPPTAKDITEQQVIPEPVPLLEEPASKASSVSDFPKAITALSLTGVSSGLVTSRLPCDSPTEFLTPSDHELSPKNQSRSCSHSSASLAAGNLASSSPSRLVNLSFDSLRYSVSDDSEYCIRNYHNSRNTLVSDWSMNQGSTELPISPDRSANHDPTIRLSPSHSRGLNSLLNSSAPNSQSPDDRRPSSSSTVISQPLPRHHKMALSYILNPSPEINESEKTKTELVHPNLSPTSRSTSPTSSSESEVSSPSASSFHSIASPVHAQRPGSHSPSDHESPTSSSATSPPSSPPPVPHDVQDLPQMVQPPQHLPWEEPPPVGLNPQNHRAYQRAGVHWMLVSSIFTGTAAMHIDSAYFP